MNANQIFLTLHWFCLLTETITATNALNNTNVRSKDDKASKTTFLATRNDKIRTFLLKKQNWPQSLGENFLKRVRKITKLPTTSAQCRIFCRNGYLLQILPNGVVQGTVDQGSKYGKYKFPFFYAQRVFNNRHTGALRNCSFECLKH